MAHIRWHLSRHLQRYSTFSENNEEGNHLEEDLAYRRHRQRAVRAFQIWRLADTDARVPRGARSALWAQVSRVPSRLYETTLDFQTARLRSQRVTCTPTTPTSFVCRLLTHARHRQSCNGGVAPRRCGPFTGPFVQLILAYYLLACILACLHTHFLTYSFAYFIRNLPTCVLTC